MREKIPIAILSPKIPPHLLWGNWTGGWGSGEEVWSTGSKSYKGDELHVGHGYLSDALSSYIEGDVDQACVKVQLLMIPDVIKTTFDGSIKRVTTLRTLTDAMNKSEIYKGMLRNKFLCNMCQIKHICHISVNIQQKKGYSGDTVPWCSLKMFWCNEGMKKLVRL